MIVMFDVDFESVFSELEEQGTREAKFMEFLTAAVPSAYFELHTKNKRVYRSQVHDQFIAGKKNQEPAACSMAIDALDAHLVFRIPETMAAAAGEAFFLELIRCAVDQVWAQMAADELRIENEQLTRQIGVLKAQHFDMVENNHRQYVLIQQKDWDYAKNLEAKIAQRTVELRRANEELKEASRLKGEFLANMSHELRTPMNAIIGFSDLLCESSLAPEQEEYAQTIKEAGGGLLSLINDILDFSKIEAGKLDIVQESFCLKDIVKNVAAIFLKAAKDKGVVFRYEIDPDIPAELIGDAYRLKQVLINLAANAMKFTKEGEVTISIAQIGARIRFLVSDTGIGIPPDKQEAIFEKFTQADGSITRNYGGTGLGLTITCQLVGLMGGYITMCSEVGRGSIFSFSLPLQVANLSGLAPVANNQSSSTGSGLRILVVEDNAVNQKLATTLLKREGCEVEVACDGLKAIEALKEQAFDLILMDLQMPVMDGREATRQIRSLERDDKESYLGLRNRTLPIPIVGLSAHARKDDADEARAVGMDDFLTKPIVKAKLIEMIARLKPVIAE